MSTRSVSAITLALLAIGCISEAPPPPLPDIIPSPDAGAARGELRVEIRSPQPDRILGSWESSIEVEGGASVFGGVRYLELMLVLDTSRSLVRTDPRNYRSSGAIGLVQSLPEKGDLRLGVVDFDSRARLVLPLTDERSAAVEALRSLDRDGQTDLAAGIQTALAELERSARPDSSRVILLFTDGKSDEEEARRAMERARAMGIAIHTLLLGSDAKGAGILTEVARETGGSFIHVTDPAKLPEAFLDLRTTGIERVTVRVNDAEPVPARLSGGTFVERVPLRPGRNRITATATSLSGETREDTVTVTVSGPLSIAIDSPPDGTLLTHRQGDLAVEGRVDAFVGLPPGAAEAHRLGIRQVVLEVEGAPPFAARVVGGRFSGRVLLSEGTNRIRALATTLDGRSASDAVTVQVRAPGCASLAVEAVRDGQPSLSVSERAVEIVLDGSNSMWGRMEDRPKIAIAQEILGEALGWMGRDVRLSLRAYGHRRGREARDCTDSELLVPFSSDNREEIRRAVAAIKPRGQTPLAYSLGQVAGDFGTFVGERAVVLVTDGIESCGGAPEEAARALRAASTPVHVIGFGLGSDLDEDPASLEAIADASGGRFILARSAQELRDALSVTVGTPFQVLQGDVVVARGALGAGERIRLREGQYRVHLESRPAREVQVTLAAQEGLTLSWERSGSVVSHSLRRGPVDYTPCWVEATEPPGGAKIPASPSTD